MQIWPSGTLYINVLCMFAHLTCSLLQPYINCLRLGLIFFSSTLPRGKIVELACSKWKCIYEMDKATHTHKRNFFSNVCTLPYHGMLLIVFIKLHVLWPCLYQGQYTIQPKIKEFKNEKLRQNLLSPCNSLFVRQHNIWSTVTQHLLQVKEKQ